MGNVKVKNAAGTFAMQADTIKFSGGALSRETGQTAELVIGIGNASDISAAPDTTGQVLVYNGSTGKWVPSAQNTLQALTGSTITGALSTVADAPAKAVLTSIIAALVAAGATDGTT